MFNKNIYIEKCENEPKVLTNQQNEIYFKRGKWNKYFGNSNSIKLEIGTGMGNFFANQVKANQDSNFIGMELRYKRAYSTAQKCIKNKNSNFVIIKDYAQSIDKIFGEGEIDLTYILFPDPWEKKCWKKNRLMQDKFISDLAIVTKIGGKLIFKSDHREYFLYTIKNLKKNPNWKIRIRSDDYLKDFPGVFKTQTASGFEILFRNQKKKYGYLEVEKIKPNIFNTIFFIFYKMF